MFLRPTRLPAGRQVYHSATWAMRIYYNLIMWVVKMLLSLVIWLTWSFNLWRKLRVDFGSREILELSFEMAAYGLMIGTVAGLAISRSWTVLSWAAVLGAVMGLVRRSREKKWNFWEMLDELIPPGFFGFTAVVIIWSTQVKWLLDGLYLLTAWIIGSLIRKNYKSYRWYKSGKTGIVGMFYLGWWAIREIIWRDFSIGQIAGVWMLTAVAVAVYLRSERDIFSDLKVWKRKK